MSAAWPWVILGRVPHVLPISDEDDDEKAELGVTEFFIKVAPLAQPDPNYPNKYTCIPAVGPDCLLLNFAVEPFYGVNSAVDPQESYLIVARRFRTYSIPKSHAATFSGEHIPWRRAGLMPVIYDMGSTSLVSSYNGDYTSAELQVNKGSKRAKLFSFRGGGNQWIQKNLIYPLAAENMEWVPAGVVAQKNTLLWFDLSWRLLSCDPFVANPVLLFRELPEDRALNMARPDVHNHRCVRELRYVEIIPEDSGDCPEKETATVCPSNPDLVYFALEKRLFGVDVPSNKVVQIAEAWPVPASCRYVQAWNLPSRVGKDLMEGHSQEIIAEMIQNICYRAMESLSGYDPMNTKSSLYNILSLPVFTRDFIPTTHGIKPEKGFPERVAPIAWPTAICCGLMLVKLSCGLELSSLYSTICSWMEIPGEVFDGLLSQLCISSISPITDRNVMRLMNIIQAKDVSNRVTICLDKSEDGSEKGPLKAVQRAIEAIRKWCLKYGLYYDISNLYGSSCLIFTTPAGGTFYLTIEHEGKSLTLLLSGRNLYVRGWRSDNGSFEIRLNNTWPRYLTGSVTDVPMHVNYRFLCPKGNVGLTWIGPDALRDAFKILRKCKGEPSSAVKKSVATIAVQISEAARIQRVYKTGCKSFTSSSEQTLDFRRYDKDKEHSADTNSYWIGNYNQNGKQAMLEVDTCSSSKGSKLTHNSAKIFQEIRIINRDGCFDGTKEERPAQNEDPSDKINRSLFAKGSADRKRMKKSWGDFESASVGEEDELFLSRFLLEGWHPKEDTDDGETAVEDCETQSNEQITIPEMRLNMQASPESKGDDYFAEYLSHFTSVGNIIQKRAGMLRTTMKSMDDWIPKLKKLDWSDNVQFHRQHHPKNHPPHLLSCQKKALLTARPQCHPISFFRRGNTLRLVTRVARFFSFI